MKVTAAVVDGVSSSFRMQDLDLDEAGPGEALVRIVATGICHTAASPPAPAPEPSSTP